MYMYIYNYNYNNFLNFTLTGSTPNGSLQSHHVNGYRPGGQSPSQVRRMGPGVISGSPKHPPRHLGFTGGNSRSVVGSRDGNHLYPG